MRAILFILTTMAIGCSPCRHIVTSTTDSVRVEVRTHIERVPDTLFIEVPTEITRQIVRDTLSHLETSFASSDARINSDGSLYHSLENKPQKRPIPTEKEVAYRDSIIYRGRSTENLLEVERELTMWQKIQIRGFWIAITILALTYGRTLWGVVRKF